MSTLEKVREVIPDMTSGEKVQVIQWLARDLSGSFPGIERKEDVSGGEPCIGRTRIPVWVLVQARKLGSLESDILRAYPSLHAEDVSNAWAYYDANRFQIDQQIQENELA